MSAYLGTLGRLIPIYSNPSMDVTPAESHTFVRTLEGRVKAQVRAVAGRRTWELSGRHAKASDVGALEGFAAGEWGRGPFVWVAPDAPSNNLLTPEISSCGREALYSATTSVGGPMALGDGSFAGRSLLADSATAWSFVGESRVPVIPGQKVTGSMVVIGAGAIVRLTWYGADGLTISHTESSVTGVAGSPRRIHVTGTPPAGAASCLLATRGALQATRPAITWTDTMFPWGAGRGCAKAVVSSTSRIALAASSHDPNRNYSDASFTITEVG